MEVKLQKDNFSFGQKEIEAASQLKILVAECKDLSLPDFTKDFIIYTDASDKGISAVLTQTDGDGKDTAICWTSRKLLPREVNYTISEKELLAVVYAVKYFRVYCGKEFQVITDHKSLTHLLEKKETTPRLRRWQLFLQEYPIKIKYIPGRDNFLADSLSRQELMEMNVMKDKDMDLLISLHEETGTQVLKHCINST